jgi:uncharacterized protein (DUF58 family)
VGRPAARRRFALTVRGWVLLACGLVLLGVAWRFSRGDALLVGALLTCAPICSLVTLLPERRRPPLARQVPSRLVHAGQTMTIALVPLGARPLRRGDQVTDRTPLGPVAASPGAAGATYRITLTRRGSYRLGPAQVCHWDPFRLARVRHVAAGATDVAVAPALRPVALPRLTSEDDGPQSGRLTAERVPDPASVRPYQPGDARRLVHWRASLRRRRLMVRGDAPRGTSDVWLVADTVLPGGTWRGSAGRSDPVGPLEDGLALAASLGVALLRRGHRVHLVGTGPGLDRAVFEPSDGTEPLLEAFARAVVTTAEAPGWAAALEPLRRAATPKPVFLVLARVTEARAGVAAGLRRAADPAVAHLVGQAADAEANLPGWSVVREAPGREGSQVRPEAVAA